MEANGQPYLPGAAALLESLDKYILLVLNDGRHLVGRLRSLDQYLNLMMEDTCERILMPGKYCDVPLGLYIVRGDNVVMLGEIDPEDQEKNENFKRITPEELADLDEGEMQVNPTKVQWDFET